jgi:hypothetical protein
MKFKVSYAATAILVSIITIITGCAYHYVSSPQYVPLNDKKGELGANVSINCLQIGYSITDYMSLFSTGSLNANIQMFKDGGKENSGNKSGKYTSYSIDVGASLFKKSRLFNYELLAGLGAGKIKYKHEIDLYYADYLSEMNAQKIDIFIQPDFGYKIKDIIELGIFSKLIYEKYYDVQTSTDIGDNLTIDSADVFFENRTHANLVFTEPGLLIRAGFKKVKFYCELSVPLQLTNADIRYKPFNMYLGASFSTDLLKQDKN